MRPVGYAADHEREEERVREELSYIEREEERVSEELSERERGRESK
jgi:hypothetical protein